jgi:hypothetical protein
MNAADLTHVVILIVVSAGWIAFWVMAVASILRRPAVSSFERGSWIVMVIIFPFVGSLIWFLWGRTRRRDLHANEPI